MCRSHVWCCFDCPSPHVGSLSTPCRQAPYAFRKASTSTKLWTPESNCQLTAYICKATYHVPPPFLTPTGLPHQKHILGNIFDTTSSAFPSIIKAIYFLNSCQINSHITVSIVNILQILPLFKFNTLAASLIQVLPHLIHFPCYF